MFPRCGERRRRPQGGNVPFEYSVELDDNDKKVVDGHIPKRSGKEILCRIVVVLQTGQRLDTGICRSGDSYVGHYQSTYWSAAQDDHRNDAEVIALWKLDPMLAPHVTDDMMGTVYVLGTTGPCLSCQGVCRTFRQKYRSLQMKFLYADRDLNSMTQGKKMPYGWADDRQFEVGNSRYFYHCTTPDNAPRKLTGLQQQKLNCCQKWLSKSLELDSSYAKSLRTHCSEVFEKQQTDASTKKLVSDMAEDAIIDARRAIDEYSSRRLFRPMNATVPPERSTSIDDQEIDRPPADIARARAAMDAEARERTQAGLSSNPLALHELNHRLRKVTFPPPHIIHKAGTS
jgi:hypothetical protein